MWIEEGGGRFRGRRIEGIECDREELKDGKDDYRKKRSKGHRDGREEE